MNLLRVVLLFGPLSVSLQLESVYAKAKPVYECTIAGDQLILRGAISADFVPCVQKFVAQGGNQIMVDSPGGDAAASLSLGEIMSATKPTLYITHHCNSGCANYILPLAQRVVMGPGC